MMEGKTKYILEVGAQGNPIHKRSERVMEALQSGATYIMIDNDESTLELVNAKSLAGGVMMLADLSEMPTIKNKDISEIWIINVFGQPQGVNKDADSNTMSALRTAAVQTQLITGSVPTALSVAWRKYSKIFSELGRILEDNGSIYIAEFLTPAIATDLGKIDFSKFGLKAKWYRNEKNVKLFLRKHGMDEGEYDNIMKERTSVDSMELNKPFVLELKKV